jgi:hypothetical protein
MTQTPIYTVVPLYVMPETEETEAEVSLTAKPGFVRLNSDNYNQICGSGGLSRRGELAVILCDDYASAKLGSKLITEGSREVEDIAQHENGCGMILVEDHEFRFSFKIGIEDHRSPSSIIDQIKGSWDLDSDQHDKIMSEMMDSEDFYLRSVEHIFGITSSLGDHRAVAAVQSKVEEIPGAKISFASRDIPSIERNGEYQFKNPSEAHEAILKASRRFEGDFIFHDTISREVGDALTYCEVAYDWELEDDAEAPRTP